MYLSSSVLISFTTKSSETAGFLFPGKLAMFFLWFGKKVSDGYFTDAQQV